jgi:hypothetical protein
MKKRKAYKPKPIRINAHEVVIKGVKPLTQEDKVYLFKQAIKAINAMQYKIELTTSDFTTLCDMINISLILSTWDIGKEHTDDLLAAREAMQDTKQRYHKTNQLGFNATELMAVKVALTIHQEQIELCTLAQFSKAFDVQEKRIKEGNFYRREGDLSLQEKRAA